MKYEPMGNPFLAQKVMQEFDNLSIPYQANVNHGLDHGTWIPLSIMYPEADIPTIQISVPRHQSPAFIMRMGEALSKFRDDEILLMGSGNIVHNLRMVQGIGQQVRDGPVDDWAAEFDEFIRYNLVNQKYDTIKNYREKGPSNHLAVPTTEHFNPLFFMMGATHPSDGIEFISEEFQYNNISMRSIQLNQ
jgi:4,5-DOPA dioxygenase extradiol